MERKGVFDSEVLEKVFESDNEKYTSLKKFLARTIHRYLKSNPKLRESNNNDRVYQKAVQRYRQSTFRQDRLKPNITKWLR